MTISLGYQIPNYTYPGGVETLFDTVLAQAREAESSGFDTVLVMDHFYQLPGIGSPDQPMMEAYSTLAALAASTTTIQLSALVTGNTYRNPSLLAKTVSTLDVISHGRAVLGLGAGWFELEHASSGSTSTPSPNASRSSTRPCRSSIRCCATSAPSSPASGTACTEP